MGVSLPALAADYAASSGTVTFDYRVTFIGVRGTSSDLTADVSFKPDNLDGASGTVSVRTASLKTGNGLQEEHMRGALGADAFPNMVYTLSGVNTSTMLSEGQTLVTTGSGKLSLKGVSRALTVPLKLTLNGGKVTVATQFKFNPHDFGVEYLGGADSVAVNVGFVLAPR
ncbi:YceI family protein [Deinococcus radiomollis]|uniref:YceI family protein n=1 Tax=Deinococcus radiomollis TaxID=468916 RepID=UPI00389201F9